LFSATERIAFGVVWCGVMWRRGHACLLSCGERQKMYTNQSLGGVVAAGSMLDIWCITAAAHLQLCVVRLARGCNTPNVHKREWSGATRLLTSKLRPLFLECKKSGRSFEQDEGDRNSLRCQRRPNHLDLDAIAPVRALTARGATAGVHDARNEANHLLPKHR
jgi:hypothetical protein